jgi:hypothetical protein
VDKAILMLPVDSSSSRIFNSETDLRFSRVVIVSNF